MAASQEERAEDIRDTFAMFDDWTDRYQLLIDMGQKLPPMDPADKTEETRVKGCQSNVWLVARPVPGSDRIEFVADSDSAIVKGMVAILERVYSGEPAANILSFDVEKLLADLELEQHLSMNRRNGLAGMVARIKDLAAEVAGS
ncbi:MAG TPA: SufE family protein [Chthonomonadaceae bacterium]|nr:SufE family protein [Chthonomonadaceae bacterium]